MFPMAKPIIDSRIIMNGEVNRETPVTNVLDVCIDEHETVMRIVRGAIGRSHYGPTS